MFIVSLNYKKEISEVEKYLKQHVDFLDKYYLLGNEKDKEMVINIMKEDPFYKNEIAEYEFIEFIPTKFDEKFAYFVNN